ncbi:unnamed protein product [Prunus armeniaca]
MGGDLPLRAPKLSLQTGCRTISGLAPFMSANGNKIKKQDKKCSSYVLGAHSSIFTKGAERGAEGHCRRELPKASAEGHWRRGE